MIGDMPMTRREARLAKNEAIRKANKERLAYLATLPAKPPMVTVVMRGNR